MRTKDSAPNLLPAQFAGFDEDFWSGNIFLRCGVKLGIRRVTFTFSKMCSASKDESNDNTVGTDELSVICATANIVKTRLAGVDKELVHGTKHFRGGAKVYVIDAFAGTCDSATVIGHHRKSGRYIKIVVRAAYLENFRLTNVYSPKVLELLRKHYAYRGSSFYLNHDAEWLCESVANWSEIEREN